MKSNKIIAVLMSASALGLAVPAEAAREDGQRNGRWNNASQQRTETRAARSAPQRQERVQNNVAPRAQAAAPPVQANVTPRAQASIRARNEDARRERSDDRQNWRNDRREDRAQVQDQRRDNRQSRTEVRREDRNDWRDQSRTDTRDHRRVTSPDRNQARINERHDDRRWNDRDGRRDDHRWNDRDNNKRYSWDRDWRRDQRYNWKHYRNQYRHVYHAPRYYAPRGWDYGYRRFSIGITLWSGLYSSSYWIDDPYYYRLPPVYGSLRWVRYYDDALLVDIRTGYVVDVIRDFFW